MTRSNKNKAMQNFNRTADRTLTRVGSVAVKGIEKAAKLKGNKMFKIIVTILFVMLSKNVAAMSTKEQLAEIWACAKNTQTLEAMAECKRKASEAGNSEASFDLASSYETGSPYGGVEKNDAEAERLKLLAYKQGNLGAKLWYINHYIPPKPYKWEVGMSKNQVLNSVDGEPRKVIKRSTANGETEVWVYTGAYLFFGSIKENYGCLKEIQEIQ